MDNDLLKQGEYESCVRELKRYVEQWGPGLVFDGDGRESLRAFVSYFVTCSIEEQHGEELATALQTFWRNLQGVARSFAVSATSAVRPYRSYSDEEFSPVIQPVRHALERELERLSRK